MISPKDADAAVARTLLVLAATLFVLVVSRAAADGGSHDEAVLWQARSCVGEDHHDLRVCAVMAHVHRKRAELRGVSLLTMIRLYSAPVRDVRLRRARPRPTSGDVVSAEAAAERGRMDALATRRRRWVRLLAPTGPEPEGWPERLSWRRQQARFAPVYRHVERVFRGEIEDPCPEVLHYGGPEHVDPGGAPRGFELDPTCLPDHDTDQRFYRRILPDGAAK